MSSEKEDTFPKLLRRNYLNWGASEVAFRDKEFGIWNKYTWEDVYKKVKAFSLGLISLGLGPGEKVAIIGDNEPHWYWAAFGVYAARSIVIGLFTDASSREIEYIINHSEAKFIIARDQEQVDKLLDILDKLPKVQRIVWWYPRGLRNYSHPSMIDLSSVMKLGEEYENSHTDLFEKNIEEGSGDDIANIYYTSGTTGNPKGALCSYRALLGSTKAILALTQLSKNDNILCYLPPAWIGEAFFGMGPHLITGAKLNTLEEPETMMHDIREITPALILGGPRQWEGWVSIVQAKIAESGVFEKLAYKLLIPIGVKIANGKLSGEKMTLIRKLLSWLASIILFNPIKGYLGLTKAKFPATAGSVLSPDTFRFIHALGIELRQMYGSTEGGMVTGHRQGDIRWGTIGPPLPGVEVKISDEGEILVKSEYMFSGYYKNAEATAKAFTADGFWHSGDAGVIDEKGHLIYHDRVSELGELSDGERYSPQFIESGLRFSQYIKDAMVIGGKEHTFVSAIIIIDFSNVGRWAEKKRVTYTTFTDLSQKPEVGELILSEVERINSQLSKGVRIQKFTCLHKEFDPDEADLTRTRKLKRVALAKKMQGLIESIYCDEKHCFVEASVTYQDGREGLIRTALNIYTLT